MSAVPAWKQAILDRKKKAEQEQKKKEEEEAAYIASLPPWKRALVKKQKEQQSPTSTLERKDSKERSHPMPVVDTRSSTTTDPSSKWKAALQKSRDSPKLNRPSWGANTATVSTSPPTKEAVTPTIRQASKVRLASHSFSGALSNFSSKKPAVTSSTASSVKAANTFGSFRAASSSNSAKSSESTPPNSRTSSFSSTTEEGTPQQAKSSTGVSLRSKSDKPKVQVSDKRRSFEGEEHEDSKFAAMPAWKKALIQRRKAATQQNEPKFQSTAAKPSSAPQKQFVNEPASSSSKQGKKEKEAPKFVAQTTVETKQKEPPQVVAAQTPVQMKHSTEGEDEVDSPFTLRSSHKDSYTVTPTKTSTHKDSQTPATNASKHSSPAKKEVKAAKSKTSGETQSPHVQKEEPKAKSVPASKSPSAKPIASKKAPTRNGARAKRQPEIVNRPRADGEVPTKLVEQEGTVLRPPVYKEVDEWANVTENDPSFKKLPLWKQALIKRRRNDIAKRSGSLPSEPPSDKQKPSSNTKNLPDWKVQLLNKGTKPESTKSDPQSSGLMGSGKLQPVRKAPARPAPTRSAPTPPKQEEKAEPMFTYSFSKNHRTIDAGSESEDSDSDLEDVTVTNIDESEDEDSGIDKGGIVVTSYKVTNNDYTPPISPSYEPTNDSDTNRGMKKSASESNTNRGMKKSDSESDTSRGMKKSTSESNTNRGMKKSDSKSILVDTSKKSFKSLRRVSFSDSSLTEEHFYPKYSYHDYDQVNESEEDGLSSSNTNRENSGLSQRLHPSLRPINETDSDAYRYSPSKISPMKTSSLGQYTPNMMSSFNYNDMLQNLSSLTQGSTQSSPAKKEEPIPEEPEYSTPANDVANDFYSHLNADTAALLW